MILVLFLLCREFPGEKGPAMDRKRKQEGKNEEESSTKNAYYAYSKYNDRRISAGISADGFRE